MNPRILIIEDDDRLAAMVCDYLGDNGFDCTQAGTGVRGIDLQTEEAFDAIILDLMLPDIDGLEVCRTIRAHSQIPILMLTAKGDPMDRVVGLEIGADDYLPKPFEPRELLARLRAILRRGRPAQNASRMRFGRLEINEDSMSATLDDEKCDITTHQFTLLAILAKAPGRVLSRDQLMDQLKGIDFDIFDRSIDVHISRIRAAIEDDPKNPKRIITVRGAGYVFAREQD
ncbi:response regulator [Pseudahrensia aquimaris]|uniref:Response regulator n=1 Tax=Pseudahrensia aquimaris TaxID=744461 RepID=A0ABW3FCX5_9HYPH